MRNVIISLFSLICIYLLSPYIAVFTLYVALQTGDIAGVKERVDWPSFKKELRIDLNNLIEIKLKQSLNKKLQLNFDSMTLSEQISDKIATPEGLIYLFNKPNEFNEAKLSFTMDWRLQGFFWKLVRLKIPIKKN